MRDVFIPKRKRVGGAGAEKKKEQFNLCPKWKKSDSQIYSNNNGKQSTTDGDRGPSPPATGPIHHCGKPEDGSAFDRGLLLEVFAAVFLAPMPHVYGVITASYERLKLLIFTRINSAGGGGTREGGENEKRGFPVSASEA